MTVVLISWEGFEICYDTICFPAANYIVMDLCSISRTKSKKARYINLTLTLRFDIFIAIQRTSQSHNRQTPLIGMNE